MAKMKKSYLKISCIFGLKCDIRNINTRHLSGCFFNAENRKAGTVWMDEKTCTEKMSRLEGRIDTNERRINTNERRINNHSDRIKIIETEIVGMKKDTSRLEEILDRLERAIENLNNSIMEMKNKPLEKYEKIAFYIITAIIGILIGKFFS